MGTSTAAAAADLVTRCTALVAGRDVVLVVAVVAGVTDRVRQLRAFGARRVLVVAENVGTGELPGAHEAEYVVVPPARAARRARDQIAGWVAFAADPPQAARVAVQRFDPGGGALCLLDHVATAPSYLGRESLGGRTAKAARLEDKTRCDRLWEECGVPHAAYRVVPTEPGALLAAARGLDQGLGTVWSGDAATGVNGGGDSVRWVRPGVDMESDGARVAAFLAPTSPTTRVMPFLEGVPCSIHGFVVDDGVAVFRPVELCVLRGTDADGRPRLHSGGISTCWDPPAADREHMRWVARTVGEHLRATEGYRGGFSVDGVLTTDGWLPNELNPRFSGGLATIARGVPELPMQLLQDAVVRGRDVGARARVVEDLLLPAADAHRFGTGNAMVAAAPEPQLRVDVAGDEHGLRVAGAGDQVAGALLLGPSQLGGIVRYLPAEQRAGVRLAPVVAAALALADRLWDTGIGPLTAAPDVRAR